MLLSLRANSCAQTHTRRFTSNRTMGPQMCKWGSLANCNPCSSTAPSQGMYNGMDKNFPTVWKTSYTHCLTYTYTLAHFHMGCGCTCDFGQCWCVTRLASKKCNYAAFTTFNTLQLDTELHALEHFTGKKVDVCCITIISCELLYSTTLLHISMIFNPEGYLFLWLKTY